MGAGGVGVTIAAASPSQTAGQYAASSSVALAFPNNVVAGSLLTVVGWVYTGTTDDRPVQGDLTQTAGTAALGPIAREVVNTRDIGPGAAILHEVQWSVIVKTAGSLTLTLNGGASGVACYIAIDEYTGSWDERRVVDMAAANGNGSVQSSGNVVTTGPALIVGGLMHINATTGSAATEDGAFTLIAEQDSSPTQVGASAIARIVTGATTDAADWTTSALVDWIATAVAYQEAEAPFTFVPPTLSGAGVNDITTTSARPKVTISY